MFYFFFNKLMPALTSATSMTKSEPGLVKEPGEPLPHRQDLMVALSLEKEALRLSLVGYLQSPTVDYFRDSLEKIMTEEYNQYLIDLSGLVDIDGEGLAALLWARYQIGQLGGRSSFWLFGRDFFDFYSKLFNAGLHHLTDSSRWRFSLFSPN